MAVITIGAGAADYNTYRSAATNVDRTNPANGSGSIDTVEMWFYVQNGANVKVGTFSGSGTSWDDRDYETIGTVTAGAKRTFTGLDITVQDNDIIGEYHSSGLIEANSSGGSGVGIYANDAFGSGAQEYTIEVNYKISLYGTGETVSVGARLLSLTGVGN